MGDVKMMAMVGAFTGPFGVLLTIFAGSLVGAVVGIAADPAPGRLPAGHAAVRLFPGPGRPRRRCSSASASPRPTSALLLPAALSSGAGRPRLRVPLRLPPRPLGPEST